MVDPGEEGCWTLWPIFRQMGQRINDEDRSSSSSTIKPSSHAVPKRERERARQFFRGYTECQVNEIRSRGNGHIWFPSNSLQLLFHPDSESQTLIFVIPWINAVSTRLIDFYAFMEDKFRRREENSLFYLQFNVSYRRSYRAWKFRESWNFVCK